MSTRSKKEDKKDEEEYKPSRAKGASANAKRKSDQFKLAQQQVSIKDLIEAGLLEVGQRLYVKDQEGEVTKDGMIRVFSDNGQYNEYRNPTSWTKVATGRESGGWQQIRMKPHNEVLATRKDKYLSNLMEGIYDDADSTPNTTTDDIEEEVSLPLKVRFACDDSRPFKITWVSPDYKEFHFEYENKSYTSLAEFGSKIYEDMQNDSPPTNSNFSFNAMMYEIDGKWITTDKLFELARDPSDNNNNTRRSKRGKTSSPPESPSQTTSSKRSKTSSPPESPSQSASSTPNATPKAKASQEAPINFKILLIVSGDDSAPIRVDTTATTMQELQENLAAESGLALADISEYDFTIWDSDFDTYTKFPKTIATMPTKCKVNVKRLSKSPAPPANGKTNSTDADTVMLDADTSATGETSTTTVNTENQDKTTEEATQ